MNDYEIQDTPIVAKEPDIDLDRVAFYRILKTSKYGIELLNFIIESSGVCSEPYFDDNSLRQSFTQGMRSLGFKILRKIEENSENPLSITIKSGIIKPLQD